MENGLSSVLCVDNVLDSDLDNAVDSGLPSALDSGLRGGTVVWTMP